MILVDSSVGIAIFNGTNTSHKRYESMVVYALHYALRDVKIESQFHVKLDSSQYTALTNAHLLDKLGNVFFCKNK